MFIDVVAVVALCDDAGAEGGVATSVFADGGSMELAGVLKPAH